MSRPDRCPTCRTQWGPGVLACPSCSRLVHAEELEQLAREAAAHRTSGEPGAELAEWRRALTLLPRGSSQAERIGARVAELEPRVTTDQAGRPSTMPKWLAGLGLFGLLAWKAQALLVLVAAKGKVLLAGVASWQTILSMFLSFGVYWAAWGWAFAGGLIVSMYIHELGHVVALKRYGIPASAPMFIPGIGAFVRLDRHPETPQQDAVVGLAGPWFGLAAALASAGLWVATDHPAFAAVAQVGALINLFNLIPVWQLDGGRAFASLTREQRGLVATAVGIALLFSSNLLLIALLIGASARTFVGGAPTTGDRGVLAQYVALVAALTWLAMLEVPTS